METGRKERLLDMLGGGQPEAQADALTDLRMLDLGDGRVLQAALRLCDVDQPMPEGRGSGASADPFAAFFGGGQTAQTLGEHAAERLIAAGLPGMPSVAEALAASLAEAEAGPKRHEVGARLLAESPWEQPTEAVRLALPALLKADASLFAVVAVADDSTLDLLRAAALNPFQPRLINELLNAEAARPSTLQAMTAAARRGLPDPQVALQVVALIHQWGHPDASETAALLEGTHPWAVAFTAIGDPEARPRLQAWLQADPGPLPPDLTRLISLVLEHADPLPGYPLAALLERLDGGCGPILSQGAVADCAALLRTWIRRGLREDLRLDRAWQAVELLAEIHGLQEAAQDVLRAIEQDEVPLQPKLLEALGRHDPPIPGLPDALMGLAERHPDALSAPIAGLLATTHDLTDFARRALTWAEDAPVEQIPRRRGLVEIRRVGVDLAGLERLIESLKDPALARRLDEVQPVIGPAR